MREENRAKPNQIHAFSYIRAAACVAIVLLHTVFCAVSLFAEEASQTQAIVSRCVVNNLMWAVPCFLMVSGALLLDAKRQVTIKKIFTKYIPRVLIALVVFCILFRVLEIVVNREPVTAETVWAGLYEILADQSWSHMWYLYLLIGLYLILPFYRKLAQHCSAAELRYLLLLLVVFLSLLPILKIWDIKIGFYIFTASIYPFYFFCGYALHNGILKLGRAAGLALTAVGTAAIVLFTLLKELGGIGSVSIFYGYSSIFVIMQSVGLFSVINAQPSRTKVGVFGRLLLRLDACSFGIYLIHMIFVRGILKHTPIHPYGAGSFFILAGLTLGITAVSYLITWLLKKLPGVRAVL